MTLFRWIRRDGVMHLQGRESGSSRVAELGTVTETEAGHAWETADGMYGALEPTLQHAMAALLRQVRRR